MDVARRFALSVVALAGLSVGAAAQKKGASPALPVCTVPTDKPDEVRDAASQVGIAQFNTKPDAQRKALGKAVEKLSLRPEHYATNMPGYQFTLGQALVLWSMIPNEPAVVKRGEVGFLGEKDQTIDLLVAADSLFRLVEKAVPDCADQVAGYRQIPWPRIINQVGPLINSNQLDSAQKVLDRSMVIYRDSPYPYYFQTLISGRDHEYLRASAAAEKAAKLATAAAVKDTSMAELAEQATFFAAYYSQQAADTVTGMAQVPAMKQVAALYSGYLKSYPCGANAESAVKGFFEASRTAGDTAAVLGQLRAMAAEAKPCTDLWWFNAASMAVEAGDLPLAVTLADKAVASSPWSAGLTSATQVYWKAELFAKMLPLARKVSSMKPNSADDYQLVAIAYQGLAKTETSPALKKSYTDSLLVAYNSGERLTVRLRVTQFLWEGPQRTLLGWVQLIDTGAVNAAAAAAAAAPSKTPAKKGAKPAAKPAAPPPPAPSTKPAPRPLTVRAEFLDHAGAVVATDSVTVTANADDHAEFKISVKGATIVSYRYAPLK